MENNVGGKYKIVGSETKCTERERESYSFWHHIKQAAVNKFYVINISLRAEDGSFADCTLGLEGTRV